MKKAHYRLEVNGNPIGQWKIYKQGAFFRDRRFYSKARALKLAYQFVKEGKHVAVEKYEYKNVMLNGIPAKVWDIVEDTKQVMGI